MKSWNRDDLERMIADGVEEGLALEYKRAAALGKPDGKKAEIVKDVSAFANSTGGKLIYGIAEYDARDKRHLPERLDPVDRAQFSREWLEQIIQSIQPKIEGIELHPVVIDNAANTVCYVIEIPQSHTAHQARDHVYYRRHNFNVLPMEDYEVRDVMNRRRRPQVRASVFLNPNAGQYPKGLILAKVENVGTVLVRDFMVILEIPLDAAGGIDVGGASTIGMRDGKYFFRVRFSQNLRHTPLFPGSDHTFNQECELDVERGHPNTKELMPSTDDVGVSVYADEKPPIRARLATADVIAGWTVVPGGD